MLFLMVKQGLLYKGLQWNLYILVEIDQDYYLDLKILIDVYGLS